MTPPEDIAAARLAPELTAPFLAAIAMAGADLEHCCGRLCSAAPHDICACPCAACERRRDLLEALLAALAGAETMAPLEAMKALHAGQRADVCARIVARWVAER